MPIPASYRQLVFRDCIPMMATLPSHVFLKKIGRGSYGEVYLGRQRGSTEFVAIKCIPKVKLSKRGQDNLVTEISILQKLSHPHIVRLLDFSWDSIRVYLLMEYCAGGDLSRFIRTRRRLSETVVRRFLRQLALALQYLHHKNIIHMDLKPQNILLTSPSHPVLKVTDFGFAQHLQDAAQMDELRGTLLYMAPEIFCEGVYHPSCDLWSVGTILYECLFGTPPYASANLETLKTKLLTRERVEIPSSPPTSGNCSSLLKSLLKPHPNERLTHEEFFNHPFVDLKHAPTAESLGNALSYLELAHECEQSGQLSAAYEKYTRGLAHLVSAVEYESSPQQRAELKQMASRYFDQAERVKSLLKSRSNTKVPPMRPPRPPRRSTQSRTESADFHPGSVLAVCTSPAPNISAKVSLPSFQENPTVTNFPLSGSCDTSADKPVSPSSLPSSALLSYVRSFFRRNTNANSGSPSSTQSPVLEEVPSTPPYSQTPRDVSLSLQSMQLSDENVAEPMTNSQSDDAMGCVDNILPTDRAHFTEDLSSTLPERNADCIQETSSSEKMSRLRTLSVSFCSQDNHRDYNPSSTEFDLSYLQHMALLTDTERLLELKSMCSSPDSKHVGILDSVEEFYLLLRTNQLTSAINHVEANFSDWLTVARDDPNEERRRAVMKELKLVLDLMEWSKQQPSLQPSVPENAGTVETGRPVSDELGVEALLEADSTDTSCCVS